LEAYSLWFGSNGKNNRRNKAKLLKFFLLWKSFLEKEEGNEKRGKKGTDTFYYLGNKILKPINNSSTPQIKSIIAKTFDLL